MPTISPLAASITPMPQKNALASNYLNFTNGSGNDFAQQYLPELYEAEVERYGNRTLSGFLKMVGAEMPMTSDQVVWSEQNRLHVAYNTITGPTLVSPYTADSNFTFTNATAMAIKPNQTIIVSEGYTSIKLIVKSVAADNLSFIAYPYASATLNNVITSAATNLKVFVYGSEFAKGSYGMVESIEPQFTKFENSPVIIKDKYAISGSDAAQIGWVEVATEDGTSGYLWYLKAESETRLRFEDYLEMVSVEGELATATSAAAVNAANITGFSATVKPKGTQGLFAAVEARGNVYSDFATPVGGSGSLSDFDEILKRLDKEGAIEENMMFLNRGLALEIDDMLASVNGATQGTNAVGASYGLFNNEESMALNLGFDGFRRGSYDFYKTDWKYLNDATARGLTQDIDGVMVPAGTSTVYDQILGQNIRRPFLHVRYRASEADDRKMKSWVTGSVGGAYTTDLDAMQVHFLSERCLCVQGANNFVLFKSTQA
jgi:hypothetical protein